MSRKKKHEHVNHERWLVSYADFITLLFAFFVVLFASSKSDQKKQLMMTQAMQSAFQQHGIFEAHRKTPALAPSSGGSNSPVPLAMPVSMEGVRDDLIKKQVSEALKTMSGDAKQKRSVDARNAIAFRTIPEGTVISLRDAGFFDSGSAEIRPDAMATLERIAATLPSGRVRVEGHTDNVAIHTSQFPTNWELSTARASAIARVLLQKSLINPASLSIAGYGEFHPIASNITAEGRAMNRRVDIVLLRDDTSPSAKSAGNATVAEVNPSSLQVLSR